MIRLLRLLLFDDKNIENTRKILARKPLVWYDTRGYFHSRVTINTHMDVKAGADITLSQLLWRMKYAEDFNQWR